MSDLLREVTLYDGEGVPSKHFEVIATGNVCCADKLWRTRPSKHIWEADAEAMRAELHEPAPRPRVGVIDPEIGRAYREMWPMSNATSNPPEPLRVTRFLHVPALEVGHETSARDVHSGVPQDGRSGEVCDQGGVTGAEGSGGRGAVAGEAGDQGRSRSARGEGSAQGYAAPADDAEEVDLGGYRCISCGDTRHSHGACR